jgi:DNA-binding FadR family transcriptional regulator
MASEIESDFMAYLMGRTRNPGTQLPSIQDLAPELGISISKLREQLEVARALGFIEVRPRHGIRTRKVSIAPGLTAGMQYALAVDPAYFEQIEDMREHIEACYWGDAVQQLQTSDIEYLRELVSRAWRKLRGNPIQIPHSEHRELHLTIFSRIQNPFVLGFLEAYWEAYENVGLALYADYKYLEQVWLAHEAMVEAIASRDESVGYEALVDHFSILQTRPSAAPSIEDPGLQRAELEHHTMTGSSGA